MNDIKLKILLETKLFPDEGEQFDFRGGLGNGILKQMKNENGTIYERDNPNEEWVKADMGKYLNRFNNLIDSI